MTPQEGGGGVLHLSVQAAQLDIYLVLQVVAEHRDADETHHRQRYGDQGEERRDELGPQGCTGRQAAYGLP